MKSVNYGQTLKAQRIKHKTPLMWANTQQTQKRTKQET